MKRKRLTGRQRADLFEDHKRTCWRCKQPIDPHRDDWHVGHIIDRACGGSDDISNLAPEHARCNLGYAAKVGNALAAKIERVRQRNLGVKKEPSRLARLWAWKKKIMAEREAEE